MARDWTQEYFGIADDKNVANNVAQGKVQDNVKKSHITTEKEPKSEKNTQDVQKNCLSLTEQWNRGELEDSEYYIKSNKGHIYIDVCADGSFMFTNYRSIEEVLAPVPSYEEWQQMKAFCEEFNALNVAEENQQLKECLKNCRELFDTWDYPNIVKEIDEVLK